MEGEVKSGEGCFFSHLTHPFSLPAFSPGGDVTEVWRD